MQQETLDFDGGTYARDRDHRRLSGQLQIVFDIMRDGTWHFIPELAIKCNGSHTGVSARIRDLRKMRFGGYEVESKRFTDGLWGYRLKGS